MGVPFRLHAVSRALARRDSGPDPGVYERDQSPTLNIGELRRPGMGERLAGALLDAGHEFLTRGDVMPTDLIEVCVEVKRRVR